MVANGERAVASRLEEVTTTLVEKVKTLLSFQFVTIASGKEGTSE